MERRGQILETLSRESLQAFKSTEHVMGVREREESEPTDCNLATKVGPFTETQEVQEEPVCTDGVGEA